MAVASNNIIIFPCVTRDSGDETINLKAKLMSEENITNIIKSITDNQSYVIDYDSSSQTFKIILDGYYIELYKTPCEGTKFVNLKKKQSGDHLLIGGDDREGFKGISITEDEPEDDSVCSLCLCVGGNIPKESYYKFGSTSIKMDFGELN